MAVKNKKLTLKQVSIASKLLDRGKELTEQLKILHDMAVKIAKGQHKISFALTLSPINSRNKPYDYLREERRKEIAEAYGVPMSEITFLDESPNERAPINIQGKKNDNDFFKGEFSDVEALRIIESLVKIRQDELNNIKTQIKKMGIQI